MSDSRPPDLPDSIENDLRRDWDAKAYDRVATRALEAYGPEIVGVLAARLRSVSDAAEVFSMFTEDLWRGIPGFRWQCSFRAWAYRLALNATERWRTDPRRRPGRNVPLSDAPEICALADRVWTRTEAHLRTEVKSAVRALRDELPEDDRTLLVLRIDKQMEWRDVAVVMTDGELTGDPLTRETARLRKRFQLATERLRELARERGLLDSV